MPTQQTAVVLFLMLGNIDYWDSTFCFAHVVATAAVHQLPELIFQDFLFEFLSALPLNTVLLLKIYATITLIL